MNWSAVGTWTHTYYGAGRMASYALDYDNCNEP